ncbi:MAG: CemA family-domain-containing protein [Monoraphidium minutum]|nr:MAG: CemA family-domain-containing protein [Monoraphidium minutum]
MPDPWDTSAPRSGSPGPGAANGYANGNGAANGYANGNGANGNGRPMPDYGMTDWGWDAPQQEWDPSEGLSPDQIRGMQADYEAFLRRERAAQDPPRDKWITPLLDWQSIIGAFDPDQSRTEDAMADEALTNRSESRGAIAFAARLVLIPIVTGALVGRALAEPVLSFTLVNNPDAFAMTGRQKIEGASRVHQEEARVRMMMAIGQAPPLNEREMVSHLREFAHELQEEERHRNESGLITLVCDSTSVMTLTVLMARDTAGRSALFNTIGRLFEGLSDIAKAVAIILIADTMLGYHSEEGWTGLIDVVLGHYGIEVEEKEIVLFVGIIPIAIDVFFKYWIFIGLNKISPGAVVTIKQLDRH